MLHSFIHRKAIEIDEIIFHEVHYLLVNLATR